MGTHENSWGVKTIDDLYEYCRTEILVQDAKNNEIVLAFDSSGRLETLRLPPPPLRRRLWPGLFNRKLQSAEIATPGPGM